MTLYEIVRVINADDVEKYRVEFTHLYQRAYAQAPYFESFTDDDVHKIMNELVFNIDGVCGVMLNNTKLIGLCGGYNLVHEPHVVHLLYQYMPQVHPAEVFYMADVVIDEQYRRQGLGKRMIEYRLSLIKEIARHTLVLMRTQSEGSHSKRLYDRLGFKPVPGMIQMVNTYIQGMNNRELVTQKRIFMYHNM